MRCIFELEIYIRGDPLGFEVGQNSGLGLVFGSK